MRNINIELTYNEFNKIRKVKELTGLSWKKFFFTLVEMSEMENKLRQDYRNYYYNKGGI